MNYTINVSLAPGRIARMKIVGHRIEEKHSHVRREIAVDGVTKFLRTHFALQKNAGYLSFGVHTGIGAARSMNSNVATIQQRKYPRQFALNSAQLVLYLPTMKVSAIVLKEEPTVHKSEGSRQKAEGREQQASAKSIAG